MWKKSLRRKLSLELGVLVLVIVVGLGAARAAYWWHAWTRWQDANVTVQAFPIRKERTDRDEWLANWNEKAPPELDVIRLEAEQCHVTILHMEAAEREASHYALECTGDFNNVLTFMNALEEKEPPMVVELKKAVRKDEGVVYTLVV